MKQCVLKRRMASVSIATEDAEDIERAPPVLVAVLLMNVMLLF